MNKILLIIPAFNEAESIEWVIRKIEKDYSYLDYIVVNDGSKDTTGDICKKNRFKYIDLPINLGLSGAFQTGMKYAYLNHYEYAIQYDADGQHMAEYILPLVEYARKNNLDIAIGSRYMNKRKSLSMRIIGNSLISFCIWLTTGKRIADSTSGMRVYNYEMIRKLATLYNYGPEPDTIAFLIRCGAKVGEYNVKMNKRFAGKSYLNFSSSIFYMFHMMVSILVVQWFRKKV